MAVPMVDQRMRIRLDLEFLVLNGERWPPKSPGSFMGQVLRFLDRF